MPISAFRVLRSLSTAPDGQGAGGQESQQSIPGQTVVQQVHDIAVMPISATFVHFSVSAAMNFKKKAPQRWPNAEPQK